MKNNDIQILRNESMDKFFSNKPFIDKKTFNKNKGKILMINGALRNLSKL